MSLGTWAAVALLGGCGAVLRHLAGRGVWGIAAVNVAGAFALGVAGTEHPAVSVGLLGAMTTFSTWMLQADEEDRGPAGALIAGSLVLGLLAVWAGRGLA